MSDDSDALQSDPVFRQFVPIATIFISSFCVMVIELVAGRMIASDLGASLYTWTSVIGVVLAGLAIGNYVGGLLADRFEVARTLSALFMAASMASVFVAVSDNLVGDLRTLWMLSWPARVLSHVALVFFLPSCLLGMIGPVAAKHALGMSRQTGRTLGNVYAWGVVGSIIGTFATGFFLIDWLGTTVIIMAVACVLAAVAIFFRVRSCKAWAWMAAIVVVSALATGNAQATRSLGERLRLRAPLDDDVIYFKQSQYSNIQVVAPEQHPMRREMYIDTLLHSTIDLDRPLELRYSYSKVYAAVTKRMYPDSLRVDSLMIGGGGYVYPRYMEATYPESRTDVVEIDPEVTRAAETSFGLPADTEIRSFHEDARVYVDRLQRAIAMGDAADRYDVIYVDAFNNYNVPFQLTTLEFTHNVRGILRPDGAYLIHLIDRFDESRFLGAMVNTVSEVFPYVYAFGEGSPVQHAVNMRNTYVVVGMNRPLETADLDSECSFECKIFPFTDSEFASVSEKPNRLILTDDYAPVENLIASSARTYARDRALSDWLDAIEKAAEGRGTGAAAALAQEALELFPNKTGLRSDTANLVTDLGLEAWERGAAEEATALLRRALEIEPSLIRTRLALIDCYRSLEMLEPSLPLYEGLLDQDPLVRYNYATALAKLGRYAEAAEQFRIVTQSAPTLAVAYNNYGNVLRLMGDLAGAAEQFKLALEYDPNLHDARENLALVLASLEEEAPGAKLHPAAESSQ